MDLNKLQQLITMLRAAGCEYYKTPELELYLRPERHPAVPVVLDKPLEAPEPRPEVYKRLNPNYSHPSLFPGSK